MAGSARGWRSTPGALLLRVDKAKGRVKLCAALERESFSRHGFRKISADTFKWAERQIL